MWGDRVQGTECAAKVRNHGVRGTRESPAMGPDSSGSAEPWDAEEASIVEAQRPEASAEVEGSPLG